MKKIGADMRRRLGVGAMLLGLLVCRIASAGDFLSLTATTTSGPPLTVTESGSDIRTLFRDTLQERNQFASLSGPSGGASLNFGKVPNAVLFTRKAAGTSANVSIPRSGFSKTFAAPNATAVSQNVQSDLTKQPSAGNLSQTLAGLAKWSVVDGNPTAATAFVANDAFYRWGLPTNRETTGGMWIAGSDEAIHAGGLNGTFATGAVGGEIPILDNVALSIDFAGNYRDVEGARSYTIASSVWGLPIEVYKSPLLDGFDWTLTPYIFGGASFSKQLVSGGGIYGLGGVSSLGYRTGPFTFILANQINYSLGLSLSYESIHYSNAHLNSTLLKNGVQVVWAPNENLFADGGIAYTNFLQSAAVKNYWSPSVGIGWHFNNATTIRVGLRGDYANGYTGTGIDASLAVNF
jgi:hypothetical protein